MQERSDTSFLTRCAGATPQERRHLWFAIGVLLIWAICLTAANQLIKRELVPEGPISWILAAVPQIVAIFALLVYARYLRSCDELQRLVQLEALALSCGVTVFGLAGYPLFVRLGAPPASLNDFTLVMAVAYALGIVLGWARYR